MKTLFNPSATEEILNRLDLLKQNATGQWGNMQVAQMLAHCTSVLDMSMGNILPKRNFIGKLIGRFFRPNYYNDKPFAKNIPADDSVVISDNRNFEEEKQRLKEKIVVFQQGGPSVCTTHPHSFLGALTPEQWGKGMYKHLDHHLRQFGVQ
jgi:hypothetical protein